MKHIVQLYVQKNIDTNREKFLKLWRKKIGWQILKEAPFASGEVLVVDGELGKDMFSSFYCFISNS